MWTPSTSLPWIWVWFQLHRNAEVKFVAEFASGLQIKRRNRRMVLILDGHSELVALAIYSNNSAFYRNIREFKTSWYKTCWYVTTTHHIYILIPLCFSLEQIFATEIGFCGCRFVHAVLYIRNLSAKGHLGKLQKKNLKISRPTPYPWA